MELVENLEGMVRYQGGAVVSRTLINKSTGTVSLFSFDKGEGLSEHTAPFDALVYVLDGEVNVVLGGETHLVKKGEQIIMPADISHALDAVTRFKMLLIMIKD